MMRFWTERFSRRFIAEGQAARGALALFVFALAALAPTPRAYGAAGQHGAGAELGQVILLGDFGDRYSDGLGLRLHYVYEASDMFDLLAQVHLSSHSNSDDTNNLSVLGLTPNLKANLAYFDKLVLYTFTGFGLYRVSEKVGVLREGSVTTFGFTLGGGFELDLQEHFRFGTNVSFQNIFNKTSTGTPDKPGMNIGGTLIGLFLSGTYAF